MFKKNLKKSTVNVVNMYCAGFICKLYMCKYKYKIVLLWGKMVLHEISKQRDKMDHNIGFQALVYALAS